MCKYASECHFIEFALERIAAYVFLKLTTSQVFLSGIVSIETRIVSIATRIVPVEIGKPTNQLVEK